MNKDAKIFVTGHRGLVGSAIVRTLREKGFNNIVVARRSEIDLLDPVAVKWYFSSHLPEYVFHCAAKVGGIVANRDNPVEFIVENLTIQNNIFTNAFEYHTKKLLFLGSACAYPKFALNPITERMLLTGPLEPTNEGYALSKIIGIKLCQAFRKQYGCNFISAMPTNLYGEGDNYDLENSHVLPGMLRRIHEAKVAGKSTVALWGTGWPKREFLFSDDLAEACILLMEKYDESELVNIGHGERTELQELARKIADVVGYTGSILWDHTKPDGTPDRFLSSAKIFNLGWKPRVSLKDGLKIVYKDFISLPI